MLTDDIRSPLADRNGALLDEIPPGDIISVIKRSLASIRPSEQRVAATILADIHFAVHSSSADLARRASVSEPTVTRFSRAVGCAGVRELKVSLAQSLVVGRIYLEDPPHVAAEAKPTLWQSIFEDIHAAVRCAERQLQPALLEQAAEAITNCRRLIAIGVGGGSTLVAQEVKHRFFRLGISVENYSDALLMRMATATLGKDDVVLALSTTGRSAEVNQSVAAARQYGARVIAVTRPESPLADLADIALGIFVPETPDALKPTASRYAFFAAIDLLAAATAYRKPHETQEHMRRIKYVLAKSGNGQADGPLGD